MDESIPPHLRFSTNNGYDDFHKSYQQVSQQFPNKHFPVFGPPKWVFRTSFFNCLWCVYYVAICYSGCWVYPHRLRHGRAGGSWRHVKEVLQAGGRRIVFVDGRYDRLGIGIVSKRVLVCNLHWEFTECRKFILYWLERKDCASRIFTLRLVIHESTCKKT